MYKAIVGLIEKWGCKHQWETKIEVPIYNHPNDKMPYTIKFIYCCNKCGKFKTIKT